MTATRKRTCVIVGAGIAGITAARILRDAGVAVRLLDKADRPGGRLATLDVPTGPPVDFGAQGLISGNADLDSLYTAWGEGGWLRPCLRTALPPCNYGEGEAWEPARGFGPFIEALGEGLDVRHGVRVARMEISHRGWRAVSFSDEQSEAEAMLLALPAPEVLRIVQTSGLVLPAEVLRPLTRVTYDPCYAMVALLDPEADVPVEPILGQDDHRKSWFASSGRLEDGRRIVKLMLGSSESETLMDDDPEVVQAYMTGLIRDHTGAEPTWSHLHPWRYCQATRAHPGRSVMHTDPAPLLFAGDGFRDHDGSGSGVGHAILSGADAARRLLDFWGVEWERDLSGALSLPPVSGRD